MMIKTKPVLINGADDEPIEGRIPMIDGVRGRSGIHIVGDRRWYSDEQTAFERELDDYIKEFTTLAYVATQRLEKLNYTEPLKYAINWAYSYRNMGGKNGVDSWGQERGRIIGMNDLLLRTHRAMILVDNAYTQRNVILMPIQRSHAIDFKGPNGMEVRVQLDGYQVSEDMDYGDDELLTNFDDIMDRLTEKRS